jgi:protein-S-isoprenylcysteine O-methyltransferase Ste14
VITIYTQIAYGCWPVIGLVWLAGHFGNKRTVQRPHLAKYFGTTLLLAIGAFFLFSREFPGTLGILITFQRVLFGVVGAALCIISAAFAIWARIKLGKNWSGSVATVKEGHELVQSGPYSLVRHPIYTGLFFAMLGTALTIGTVASFLGVLLGLVAFVVRIPMEEEIMSAQFPDVYPEYKKQVKTFIPFVW